MGSSKVKGIPEESLMALIFGEKPWDLRFPLCYPYIVIEENGEAKKLRLVEAIRDALSTLPPWKGKTDPEEWDAYKRVIELRFGLLDDIPKTLEGVGNELGGRTKERVRQIQNKALRLLRHPLRSRGLSRFLVSSPEAMARNNAELRVGQEMLHQTEARINRLVTILKGAGLSEKDFEGVASEDIPQTAQALREAREDREALQALIARFPNNSVWNSIARANIRNLSTLRELVKNGEIRAVRQIGIKSEAFLRQVLQAAEQEVPS